MLLGILPVSSAMGKTKRLPPVPGAGAGPGVIGGEEPAYREQATGGSSLVGVPSAMWRARSKSPR
jgi:hypothetical protein